MAREDSCHGDSGDGEGGLFDRRAAAACGGLQARQPESASAVTCGGAGWDEPGRCRADRWHGPPDAAGLGAPLHWQYLRQNWLSNRVFETYEAIIEAACDASRSLLAEPTTITSIGHRGWAHVGQK